MKNASEKKKRDVMAKAQKVANKRPSKTDPMGSYTGLPANQAEVPVQDADDL